MANPTSLTLSDRLFPAERLNPIARGAILAIIGSLLLVISAKISVPFWPVPMTMQTGVVLLIGAAYGWRLGVATVLLYLAQGAMGLPVFTGTPEKGIGIVYMMGTTGGFLLGFILMAAVAGWFAERGVTKSIVKTGAVMFIAGFIVYVPGLLWLGSLLGWDKPILEWGFYPFVAGDLTKIALATVIAVAADKGLSKLRR
ncbi:MAG: biotin transporter BioY [Pseudomonadota bacterium]